MLRTRPPFDLQYAAVVQSDPQYQFVVTPPAGRTTLRVGNVTMLAGEMLDKSKVDSRRLCLMYQARLISVAPGHASPPVAGSKPRAVGRPNSAAGESTPKRVVRRRLMRAA